MADNYNIIKFPISKIIEYYLIIEKYDNITFRYRKTSILKRLITNVNDFDKYINSTYKFLIYIDNIYTKLCNIDDTYMNYVEYQVIRNKIELIFKLLISLMAISIKDIELYDKNNIYKKKSTTLNVIENITDILNKRDCYVPNKIYSACNFYELQEFHIYIKKFLKNIINNKKIKPYDL